MSITKRRYIIYIYIYGIIGIAVCTESLTNSRKVSYNEKKKRKKEKKKKEGEKKGGIHLGSKITFKRVRS
jgi:hypothetical protein